MQLRNRLYEAMFLIDAAKGPQLPAVVEHIVQLLERHGAQLEQMEKWAERKLTYPIRRVERGIYLLAYFRADPARIAELRRDIRLSEQVLRVLILLAKKVPEPTGELLAPKRETRAEEPLPQTAPAAEAPAPDADAGG